MSLEILFIPFIIAMFFIIVYLYTRKETKTCKKQCKKPIQKKYKSCRENFEQSKEIEKFKEDWSSTEDNSCKAKPLVCPVGAYCPSTGLTEPLKCQIGNYCPVIGLDAQTPCTIGNYCPITGMSDPTPCPIGSYCAMTGMSDPTPCPIGSYCQSTGMSSVTPCTIGNYCPIPGMSDVTPCPIGSYCPIIGMTGSSPCTIGNYCPKTGMSDVTPCPVGYYCQSTGMSEPGDCATGYYCPTPATSFVCPTGYFCPNSSNCGLVTTDPPSVVTVTDSFSLGETTSIPFKDTGLLTSMKLDIQLPTSEPSIKTTNATVRSLYDFELYIDNNPTGLTFNYSTEGSGNYVNDGVGNFTLKNIKPPVKTITLDLTNQPKTINSNSKFYFKNITNNDIITPSSLTSYIETTTNQNTIPITNF